MLLKVSILLTTFFHVSLCLGWAGWSPWTSCSKTCGGGVSQQLRRCLESKCSGHSFRYRICNTLDCDKPSRSVRDTVCSGEIIVSKQQCEVVCRSRSSGSVFLWRVADGTPCQAATNRAVCSQGACQIVGCDDVIGSSLRFDACGVCGGRGDTCENAQFVWKTSGEFTPCASSCDVLATSFHGGRDIRQSHSIVVCINSNTQRIVPERLCADRKKPKIETRQCPELICPSNCRWLSSDWSDCHPHCGEGRRTRTVYCVHQTPVHSVNVPEHFCMNQTKPVSEEICSSETCGKWETGSWSRCSVRCGQGIRRRKVECVGGNDCAFSSRPSTETECYAGVPCDAIIPEPLALTDNRSHNSLEWSDRRYLDGTFDPSDGNGHSPRIIPGAWSACSSSCGSGVQSRSSDCMALHPITANLIKLPYSECQSLPQPSLYQPCEIRACPLQEDPKIPIDNAPYRWEHGEWTQCSHSCLGGKQKAILKCIEVSSGRSVPWNSCNSKITPPEKVRQCNTHPCPPLWQVGAYEPCSTTCGSGTSTRSVKCVRPVSRNGGADAHIVLPDSDCPIPKPSDSQHCNIIPCPATWITGEWTECSASCGSGEQRRRVLCEGKDSKGRRDRSSEKDCMGEKPQGIQMCSLGSCDKPELLSNRVFEQNAPQKKITLTIGGVATVYQGTSIKIRCPRKNFDKKRINWAKNGKKIRNDAHMKVSSNGNLRIFHARLEDSGLYECFTSTLVGNLTIIIKYDDEEEKEVGHRLAPSEMMKPIHKQQGMPNTSFIEALLSATNDVDVARELEKYRGIINSEWVIGHWSDCRQTTCGVAGYQARGVSCRISMDADVRTADGSICAVLTGPRPSETRPCHREDCPEWEATEWSECSQSKCMRDGLAQQKREVRCVLKTNGTEVEQERCDRTQKPKSRKECQSELCRAEWRASAWGSCSSACGTGGVQLRLLSCVWSSSGKAAGRSCENLRRPSAARACPQHNLPACTPEALRLQDSSCEDQSRFCDIIKLFHSCDTTEVRQRCCSTCTYIDKKRFL